MTRSQTTIKPIDSGQLKLLNKKNMSHNQGTKLEVLNSIQNQGRTLTLNVCTDIEMDHEIVSITNNASKNNHKVTFSDSETVLRDNTTSNQQRMLELVSDVVESDQESPNNSRSDETIDNHKNGFQQDQYIGVNFRMEINSETNPTEEAVIKLMFSKVADLIQRWINNREINGIGLKDGRVIKEGINQRAKEWATDHRVMHKKKVIYVETYLKLQTILKVAQLHSSVKELCTKYHIKLETKRMMEGFTKRIGFLVGPYVKAASTEYYINQLKDSNNKLVGSIEIKKQMTYERGVQSKVLVVYGRDQEASKLDMEIMSKQHKGTKYLSYKRSKSEERVAAMYYNDVINVNARYEILFGAKVDDIVRFNGKAIRLKSYS